MKRAGWLLALVLALNACALPAPKSGSPSAATDRAVHLDLIRGMLARGQYYAALAHLDEERRTNGASDELTSLRADTLAAMGRRSEAEALYRSLLETAFTGEAYHGLGLLYVRSDPRQGIADLRSAVDARPTDAQWRNDLGYALMSNHRYAEAQLQLATATELDPTAERYRNNLVILLILMKDEPRVQRLAREWDLKPATLAELRRQAQAVAAQAPGAPRARTPARAPGG